MPSLSHIDRGVSVSSRITQLDLSLPSNLIDFPTTHRFLWKSPRDRKIFLSLGKTLSLEANGLDRIQQIMADLERIQIHTKNTTTENPPDEAAPRYVGGLSFFPENSVSRPWEDDTTARFVLPRFQILKTDEATWLTVNSLKNAVSTKSLGSIKQRLDRFQSTQGPSKSLSKNSVQFKSSEPEDTDWSDKIADFAGKCRDGAFRKIVPAQQRTLKLKRPITLPELYRNFTVDNPKTFRFINQTRSSDVFVGASPEKLVSKQGRHIETESIAGTTRSDESKERQQVLAKELSESDKDRKEHDHVVEYLRDRLMPMVSTLETVPRSVRRLNKVQHLVTALTGNLKSNCHILNLVRKLHPTPAVCGRPAGFALEALSESESFDRGRYAAPIGWFNEDGDGEFSVAIRSALIQGNIAHTYAGAGIIGDSNAQEELEELRLKFDSIQDYLLGSESR
jgi:menaquinone-specific isochorismate synthase